MDLFWVFLRCYECQWFAKYLHIRFLLMPQLHDYHICSNMGLGLNYVLIELQGFILRDYNKYRAESIVLEVLYSGARLDISQPELCASLIEFQGVPRTRSHQSLKVT